MLVAVLVALPVGAMVVAAALFRAGNPTYAEDWEFRNGQADVVRFENAPGEATVPVALPEGSRVVSYRSTYRMLSTGGGHVCQCEMTGLPLGDPITEGIVRLTEGRLPEAGEVLLSSPAARALRVDVGDEVRFEHPAGMVVSVVGLGEWRGQLDHQVGVVGAGMDSPALWGDYAGTEELIDLPDDVTESQLAPLRDLEYDGLSLSPELGGDPTAMVETDTGQAVTWTWAAGAVGLTVLGIIISAAFAVSARRQLTTLGQLSANGASPGVLRRTLFLQGTWTGLVGAAAGVVIAGGVLAVLQPWLPQILGRDLNDYGLQPVDLLPVVPMAVLASTVAAMLPAAAASRVSVLAALAGRKPAGRVSRRLTAAGILSVLIGLGLLALATIEAARVRDTNHGVVVWQVTATIGAIALLLGICAGASAYVQILNPLARATRGSWRLAARSLARHRARTGPVVAAVAVTTAAAVSAAGLALGAQQLLRQERWDELPQNMVRLSARVESPAPLPDRPPMPPADVVELVRDEVRATEVIEVSGALPPGVGHTGSFVPLGLKPADPDWRPREDAGFWELPTMARVADDALLDAFDIDAAARRRLDQLGAVLIGPTDGTTTVEVTSGPVYAIHPAELLQPRAPTPGAVTRFDVALVGPDTAGGLGYIGGLLVTPTWAERMGFVVAPHEIVLRAPRALTSGQRNAIGAIVELAGESNEPGHYIGFAYGQDDGLMDRGVIEAGLAAAVLLFALLVVAANLALAAAETRDERDVLNIVGASPRTLRRASAYKAVLLTALGAILAVPAGWLPVAIHLRLDGDGIPSVFPWRTVALLVVAVPLVAGGLTAAVSRVGLRVRPIQMSTGVFE